MTFVKYQHLERFGTQETDGILDGTVHIFPKLDGTNASIWWDDGLHFGSRNRELTPESDNAGFMNTMVKTSINDFFEVFPNRRLYGEWLVPHTLKTYDARAWRRFYVFDVMINDKYLHYDEYSHILSEFGIDYIPPICTMERATPDMLLEASQKASFLIEDGKGNGEGIVIKNYDYKNKYGRQTWAKVITNEFKSEHHKVMGAPLVLGTKMVEDEIVEEFVTESFVLKEKAKIENEKGEWNSKMIPMLLGVVFYELIREETWNIMKKHKNPKIDFGLLNKLTIMKTKKVIGL